LPTVAQPVAAAKTSNIGRTRIQRLYFEDCMGWFHLPAAALTEALAYPRSSAT